MTQANQWADLRVRIVSALVLIALAAFEVYEGGTIYLAGVILLISLMVWEIAALTVEVRHGLLPKVVAAVAGLCLYLWTVTPQVHWGFGLLVVPSVALLVTPRRDRIVLAVYALAVMVAGTGFLTLRALGTGTFLWLVLIVVVSDTLGYFVGRMMGGPKFWPRISPKKTWSGTVAGWVGAAVIGVIFGLFGYPKVLMILSPLIAFAGQMGDIAESWIKRRAGVKDSSSMIPGHGGVLDRFDALVGAMLAVQLVTMFLSGLG